MSKSILAQMKERRASYDRKAIVRSIEELEYINRSRQLLHVLISAEQSATLNNDLVSLYAPGEAAYAITYPFPINSAASIKTACSPYDKFPETLVSSDLLNWLSKVRAQARDPDTYGPNAKWSVFHITQNQTSRLTVEGRLSSVVRNFPDTLTAFNWLLAGVEIPAGIKIPSLIIRQSVYDEIAGFAINVNKPSSQ